MEKAFVWYPVYKKLPDTNRTVIIQCENLDEPTVGYFNNITREWAITDTELYQELENDVDLPVLAWMEMPPNYMDNKTLEFRSAAETRYFMSVSAGRNENTEIAKFYKIRNAIYFSAQRGLSSCIVQADNVSEGLITKLKNVGYSIQKDGDTYVISWI